MIDNRKILNILLIGQSSAGKTTFINSFVNYEYEGQYQSPRILPVSVNENINDQIMTFACNVKEFESLQRVKPGASQTLSQTAKCTMLQVPSQDGQFIYNLIDSPGIGDSTASKDEENLDHIKTVISSLDSLHAIVLCWKGSECRNNEFTNYLLNSLSTLLPANSVKKSVIVVYTHAPGIWSVTARDIIKQSGLGENSFFCFENIVFKHPSWYNSNSPPVDQSVSLWKHNLEEHKQLRSCIQEMTPLNLTPLRDLYLNQRAANFLSDDLADVSTKHENQLDQLNATADLVIASLTSTPAEAKRLDDYKASIELVESSERVVFNRPPVVTHTYRVTILVPRYEQKWEKKCPGFTPRNRSFWGKASSVCGNCGNGDGPGHTGYYYQALAGHIPQIFTMCSTANPVPLPNGEIQSIAKDMPTYQKDINNFNEQVNLLAAKQTELIAPIRELSMEIERYQLKVGEEKAVPNRLLPKDLEVIKFAVCLANQRLGPYAPEQLTDQQIQRMLAAKTEAKNAVEAELRTLNIKGDIPTRESLQAIINPSPI